ncbi:MAG: PAS domain-containing protein [Methanomicrobiales archaeon]|nr:PAS domain-containing protein [Methanomicrobiales archaeon]
MFITAFLIIFTIESGIILLYLASLVYRRKHILGQSYFWIILFLMGLICITIGLYNTKEVFPTFLPDPVLSFLMFFMIFLGHLVTTFWFLFCLRYSGRTMYLTKHILTFLLAYTVIGNLVFQAIVQYGMSSGYPVIDTMLWFIGYSAFIKCPILFLWGIGLLILTYRTISEKFRHQVIVLVGGACLVVLMVTFFDSGILPSINPVGMQFAITGYIFAYGILYYDLLTFSPVFREKFFGVVESGLIVLNKNIQILDMNSSAEGLLHVQLKDVFGKKPSETDIPDEFREIFCQPEKILTSSHVCVPGHEEVRWYNVSMQHDRNDLGNEEVFLLIVTDITHNITLEKEISKAHEELVAEREKKKREWMYREFFRSHRDAILIISNGLVIDCNPVAEQLFGKNREEIIGNNPVILSAPSGGSVDIVPDKLHYLISKAASGELVDFPWVFLSRGREIETEVRLNRLTFHNQFLVEMSIRDMSGVYETQLKIQTENEDLKNILAREMDLWSQVERILHTNPLVVAGDEEHEVKDLVEMARQNLQPVIESSGDTSQEVLIPIPGPIVS